jgi:hypothetical protein
MALTKITDDLNVIQKLDNEPNDVGGLTPDVFKAKFDEGANKLKSFINDTMMQEIDNVFENKANKDDTYQKNEVYTKIEANEKFIPTDNALAKDNTQIYAPLEDYNPATKKYVDDTTAGVVLGQISDNSLSEQKMANDMKKDISGGIVSHNKFSASMADIAYKQATISGREIQLTVPSFTFINNKYVSVEITADIPEGNSLTVKVNSDASITLKDTDGNSLTSLDKGFYTFIARTGTSNFFLCAPKGGGDIFFSKYVDSGEIQLYDKPIRVNQYIYASNDVVIQTPDNMIQKIPSIYNAESESQLIVNETGMLKVMGITGKTNVNGFISKKSKGIITPNKSHWTYGDKISLHQLQYSNGFVGEIWRLNNVKIRAMVQDKKYIYAVSGEESKDLIKINKVDKTELWRISYSRRVDKLLVDNDFLYVNMGITIKKINKENKSVIWEFEPSHGRHITTFSIDENYIYIGGYNNSSNYNYVSKIRKSNKTSIWDVRIDTYGHHMSVDNDNIYYAYSGGLNIIKISDGSTIYNYRHYRIDGLEVNDEYIYLMDNSNDKEQVIKVKKTDYTHVWTLEYVSDVKAVAFDEHYIYVNGRKVNKADKQEIWDSNISSYSLVVDGDYIYIADYDSLRKIQQEEQHYVIK